jgi:hypothetical protein
MQDRYEEALKYFKLGNNRSYFSMAYKKYRSEKLSENFGLFAMPLLIVFGAVVFAEYKHHKRAGEQ